MSWKNKKNMIRKLIENLKSFFDKKENYESEDVIILMTQLSTYLTTKELSDLHKTNFSEWSRRRDWFIEHTMKKYKGIC